MSSPNANAIRGEIKGLFGGRLFEQVFRDRKDSGNDHVHSFAVGMEPVRLVEGRLGGDAIEEEGVEKDAVFLGKPREERVEFLPIFGSEIARGEHAGEEDGKLALLERSEDLVEGLLGLLGFDASERVIGAKLQDDAVNFTSSESK